MSTEEKTGILGQLGQILSSWGMGVIKKSKYGTAMDPILIMVTVVSLPCILIYAFIRFWPLLIIACTPIVQFIRVYDYFMKKNPGMLRTEKHEETMPI